jgi:hypothetical protein
MGGYVERMARCEMEQGRRRGNLHQRDHQVDGRVALTEMGRIHGDQSVWAVEQCLD